MLKGYISGLFLLLISGASVAQTGSRYPMTYKNRQIIVGSGGGFTGASTAYYLLENGYLYSKSNTDSLYTRLGRQPTAITRRLFHELETTCRIKTAQFDHPGNTYRFVGWKKGPQDYRVTWGESGKTVPASFTKFYNAFMKRVLVSKREK
ncbi:hypothetical protein GCM10027347_46630 [Larkinella harenae]